MVMPNLYLFEIMKLSAMRSAVGRDAETMHANRDSVINDSPDYVTSQMSGSRPEVVMQGYLFKRGSAKTFKSWKRRWY